MSRKAGIPNKPKVEIPTGYKDDKFDILPPSGKDMLKETMPKYFVLESYDKSKLAGMVINAMDMDCECQGGVSVTNYRANDGSITMVYCQALVKKD